ncbi:hypothetical protein E4K67_25520 [Desulfosporosinus fructosivorans]|uniref:DUF3892 domain-containing protein n=1 Tax=Desulfosporosinus fructosivorans TaxID=2018669 RepID=A0A4Z0R158_9FIRM|nr:hypothetical protein [Desulfosporosinus fructosivorans]TGE35356.1 hypothetical protein E4K67_25520 [Desulfosporosinus fructosivorans]
MGDYGIYKVRFNINHSKIREAQVYKIKDNTININESITMNRESIISKIYSHDSFVTLIKDPGGYLQKGAEVYIYQLCLEDYIKTEDNCIRTDYLGKLSEF